MEQLPLFPLEYLPDKAVFPSTRYQGSKRKLIQWIGENLAELKFETVLDAFGGTGVVSHLLKCAGKTVIYNDALRFNWWIGRALIENAATRLTPEDTTLITMRHPDITYPNFIQTTFEGIYFTNEENAWLDMAVYNLNHLIQDPMKQALGWFGLFQSCIIKRPYNLFHRANLYMRQADVQRSFGNKTTWDKPFEAHFRDFIDEANRTVFDNGKPNCALCSDALEAPAEVDLVYIDPPYLNAKGVGVDYRDFYHFLEGMVQYESWATLIDYSSKHRRLQPQPSAWNSATTILSAFEKLIQRFQHSTIVISYRDDGIPSQDQIAALLSGYKREVKVLHLPQKYVLSRQKSHELLFIATS
jgi:adenine-specific DNA-methyltransferase